MKIIGRMWGDVFVAVAITVSYLCAIFTILDAMTVSTFLFFLATVGLLLLAFREVWR